MSAEYVEKFNVISTDINLIRKEVLQHEITKCRRTECYETTHRKGNRFGR